MCILAHFQRSLAHMNTTWGIQWYEVVMWAWPRNKCRLPRGQLTWSEECNGFQAAVFCRVYLQSIELLHLILKYADLIHEGHNTVSRHGGSMEASSCQQRSHVEGQRWLGGIEDEELTPAQTQQGNLIRNRQVREERNIPGPLHCAEEQPGCKLTNVINAHNATLLGILGAETGSGVRLSPQQLGNQFWHRLPIVVFPTGQSIWAGTGVGRRNPASLDSWKRKETRTKG